MMDAGRNAFLLVTFVFLAAGASAVDDNSTINSSEHTGNESLSQSRSRFAGPGFAFNQGLLGYSSMMHYNFITDNFKLFPNKLFPMYVAEPPRTSVISDLSSVVRKISQQKVSMLNPLARVIKIGNYAPTGDISLACPVVKTQDLIPWVPGVMRIDFKIDLSIPLPRPQPVPPMLPGMPPKLPAQQPPLQETIVIVLQMAAMFRKNIVTVMGYVLNNPDLNLSVDLYMALREIHTCARLRQIRVADVLHILQAISMQEPQQQCITILREIVNVSPPHIHSSIQLWLNALTQNLVKVNRVFRPQNAHVIDFLAGIDFTYINLITQQIPFPPSINNHIPRDVQGTMGKLFAKICAALSTGTIPLTQSLAAAILLHIQPNRHAPEVEENLLFMADLLFKGTKELDPAFSGIDSNVLQNPYDMLQNIFLKMKQANLSTRVREITQLCYMYLQKSKHVVIDNDFRPYFKFASASEMDLDFCFRLITPGEYPPDIIMVRDQITTAVIKREINMDECLVGFVPHDYVHPLDMLLAIVERIVKRAVLPTYLQSPVATLYVHLRMKVHSLNLEMRAPRGFEDVSFLFDAFKSPNIPANIRSMSIQILEYLRQEASVDWISVLKHYPLHIYSRPRQLVFIILNDLLTQKMLQQAIAIKMITEFVNLVDVLGEPKVCPPVTCPGPSPPIYIPVPTHPSTTPAPPPPPPPPVYEPPRTILMNVNVISLIRSLGPNAIEDPRLEALIMFITSERLFEIIGKNFDVSAYPTCGELLRVIMQRCLQSNKLDTPLVDLIRYWQAKISLNGYGASKVEFYQKVVKETRVTVNMNTVLQALDLSRLTNLGKIGSYIEFSNFLNGYFNPRVHLQGFDFMNLKTCGEFLVAFFRHLQGIASIQNSYRNAVKELMCCVQTSGAGGKPVETLLL